MMTMRATECPCCGAIHDAATGLKGEAEVPKPGDLSVCISCGAVCEYDQNMERELVPEERLAGADMVEARRARHIIRRSLGFPG
jgi:hypothetical protein